MSNLTDPPRQDLTEAQVHTLLTGQGVTRGFGMELLDASNAVLADISADVHTAPKVTGNNTGTVHKSLTCTLARELPWGSARVKPFVTLTKGGTSARFDQGVFVLNTPTTNQGRTPILYEVVGQDLLYVLDRQIGETRTLAANGTLTYLDALRQLLVDAGLTATLLLDGARQDTVIPATRVWALPGNPTWLGVANDLLAEIAYTDLFTDDQGRFRSRPVADDAVRPPLWRFDTGDKAVDLISADRPETLDLWGSFNSWRFVRNQPAGAASVTPTVANGLIYAFTNQSDGPSSVDSVGRRPAQVQNLDVADTAALIAEGNRLIAADRRSDFAATLSVDPLPIAGYQDVVEYGSDGVFQKLRVASWEVTAGGKGTWVLGGQSGDPSAPVSVSATGTITSAAPLRVVCDGATVDSFANALDATPYAVGNRVSLTVRSPQPPLIQGVETS